MANTLTNIIPKLLARGLMTLRARTVMPTLVNREYSLTGAQKGSTIDVPVPTAIGVRDVTPSNVLPVPTDSTPALVQVTLDQWKQNDPFYLTDQELTQIDANEHFIPMSAAEAVSALASSVNSHIMSQYYSTDNGVYGAVSTAGTTPFATTADIINAKKVLNQQKCPKSNRNIVINFDAEAAALALSDFGDANKAGTDITKREGEIGYKYGFNWYADDEAPTHTAGTILDGGGTRTCAVNNGAGYAAGVQFVNVDNGAEASVAGTITLGDIISFAGHSQTYTVVENTGSAQYSSPNYTFATNAIAGLKFYPALKSAVADDEVITVEATHVVNLAFHRDAFAFASAPLADAVISQTSSNIMSMQDPQTGLILRLEVRRQHKQTTWEFDILWGARLIRPELAVRIMG